MKSTALSRSELLVRLNALADETRLKIIELLTQNEEMCAQDFITMLDLSQSSASRHLRQLTHGGRASIWAVSIAEKQHGHFALKVGQMTRFTVVVA